MAVVLQNTSPALDQRANEDDRRLLERFPNNRRSYISNTFLEVVRAGARTPLQVLAAVNENLRQTHARALRWNHLSDIVERTFEVQTILDDHHAEAMAFAGWAIAWCALPQSERERLKAQKGAEHRQAYMAQKPATDRQKAYLVALGHTGEVASMAEASELIERLKRGERVEVSS